MYRHGIYVSEQETSMIAPLNGMFFFLMIFMAEPSVLSVTCSENTALSTLTWRWMILTQ